MGCTRALAARHPVRRWLPSPPAQGRCARRPRPLRADVAPRQRTLESEMQAQRRRHHHPSLQHNGPVRPHSRGMDGQLMVRTCRAYTATIKVRTSAETHERETRRAYPRHKSDCATPDLCQRRTLHSDGMQCSLLSCPWNGPALMHQLHQTLRVQALYVSLLHTLLKFGPGSLPGSRFKFFLKKQACAWKMI